MFIGLVGGEQARNAPDSPELLKVDGGCGEWEVSRDCLQS